MNRPALVVVVLGTGTEVGKTWVSCRLLEQLRSAGVSVAARKPAQSFDPPGSEDGATDADLLAHATGELAEAVCRSHRWYPKALAPPMAADRLGRPPILLDDLVGELGWPRGVAVGLVETAGGVRSPIAHDGDGAALAHRLAADLAVLVADAGLGTVHAVRASAAALTPLPVVVLLNRYDDGDELHRANRDWLVQRDGLEVVTDVAAVVTCLTS
ncbi:MAG: ATP-dependent dethiobiotin synthetase BioD [Acidimicrobiales bacterium]